MWQLTFLQSAFLWGAALVAVPLVLHLVMRRQPRHLEFPALRFIRQRESANRRQMKFRHWLLLALRMLVIALLAAALARPSLQGSGLLGDQEAPVAAALVFESSPRMDYRHQNQTRLEAARETALWLLPQLPHESEVAVIDSRYGSAAFLADASAARQRIERLGTSPVGSSLATTVGDALRLLGESTRQRKELYIFTDLAQSNWSPQATQALRKQIADSQGVGLYVIDVGVEQPQDFGVAALKLSAETITKGSPLSVQVELVHTGPAAEREVELYLSSGAAALTKRSQQTVHFEADQPAEVSFQLGGLEADVHQGYVKIVGSDSLAVDDTRFFSVDVTPTWKILLAAPKPADDYTLFLGEALAPYGLRIKGEAAFQCDTVVLDDLAKKPLADYAVVALVDPTPLPDDVWRQLTDYTASGHGLAIFLGRNALGQTDAFNQTAPQQLLPGKLQNEGRAPDDIYLAPEQFEHPLLAKFRPLASSIPWDAFPIFKYWHLAALDSESAVVIPYSNTLPALVEKPVGAGRVLTFTTPVSDFASDPQSWNRLPTGEEPWPFVMLANEMMYYLAGNSRSSLNYDAGDTAIVRLSAGDHHSIFSLVPPQGDPVRQPVDERQNAIVVTGTEEPGNYRLAAGGAEDGTQLGFSVNVSPEVSQLQRTSADELKKVFGKTPFRVAHNREEIVRDVNFGRVGRELYPLLMVLLVLILAAEQILANRFYRPGERQARSLLAGFERAAPSSARETVLPSVDETAAAETPTGVAP